MFIDPDIPIPDGMPSHLMKDFADLQRFYDEGDWIAFENKLDGVECRVKNCVLDGRISREDAVRIFHRYGNMI